MPSQHPIVLLTDFGTSDAYAASMKGVILTIFPRAVIVDLSHEVEPQDLVQASFLLENTYRFFPSGSIFVTVVDPGVGSERRILAARTRHGIFLAPDNGVLGRTLEREKTLELRWVNNPRFFLKEVSHTFHGRDCFAPTAAWLAKRPQLFSQLGPRIGKFRKLDLPAPRAARKKIVGEIIFFDRFGNAFTNISQEILSKRRDLKSGRVRVGRKTVGKFHRSYFEGKKGEPIALMSSSKLVEIAVNHGSARDVLKLKKGVLVEIA